MLSEFWIYSCAVHFLIEIKTLVLVNDAQKLQLQTFVIRFADT